MANDFWNDVQLKVKEIREPYPLMSYFSLDLQWLKSRLQQAPVRFKATSDIIVVLPGYQESYNNFGYTKRLYLNKVCRKNTRKSDPILVRESMIPSTTAKSSYSPTRIHAMILSAQYPTVYIDPIPKDKGRISYTIKQLPSRHRLGLSYWKEGLTHRNWGS